MLDLLVFGPVPSLLKGFAPHAALLALVFLALRSLRRWPTAYAATIWPGTVAHEVLHYAAGVLTGARPVAISLLPRRQSDGSWELGSVSFTRLRWWNSVPVALAPMALLPAGVWAFMESTALPALSVEGNAMKLISVQCLLAGWPSPRDWFHAIVGLLVMAAVALLILGAMRQMPFAWA